MNTRQSATTLVWAAAMAAPLAVQATTNTFRSGESIFGQPANGPQADLAVDIRTQRHLNVDYGKTVTFRGPDGKAFSWKFNGLDRRRVTLAEIAPTGFPVEPVQVYVGRNPSNRP